MIKMEMWRYDILLDLWAFLVETLLHDTPTWIHNLESTEPETERNRASSHLISRYGHGHKCCFLKDSGC